MKKSLCPRSTLWCLARIFVQRFFIYIPFLMRIGESLAYYLCCFWFKKGYCPPAVFQGFEGDEYIIDSLFHFSSLREPDWWLSMACDSVDAMYPETIQHLWSHLLLLSCELAAPAFLTYALGTFIEISAVSETRDNCLRDDVRRMNLYSSSFIMNNRTKQPTHTAW